MVGRRAGRPGGLGLAALVPLLLAPEPAVALWSGRPRDWKPEPPKKGTVTPSPWTLPQFVGHPSSDLPLCDQRADKLLYSYDVPSNAGLVHRKLNLATMARDALQMNRTLVLGRMHTVLGTHNKGRPFTNSWAKYVDMRGIEASLAGGTRRCKVRVMPMEEVPFELVATKKEQMQTLGCRQMPAALTADEPHAVTRDSDCGNGRGGIISHNIRLDTTISKTPVMIPPAPQVLRLAKQLIAKFPAGSWYAHVRRTDAVDETKPCDVGKLPLGLATTGDGLLPYFEKHIPMGAAVFMATDEPNREVFRPLAKHWQLLYEDDVKLTDGSAVYPDPEDNYFTYAVSQAAQQLFSESPGHKVLVADRNGDAGADVQVCNKEETTQRQGWWNLGQ